MGEIVGYTVSQFFKTITVTFIAYTPIILGVYVTITYTIMRPTHRHFSNWQRPDVRGGRLMSEQLTLTPDGGEGDIIVEADDGGIMVKADGGNRWVRPDELRELASHDHPVTIS